MTSRFKVAARKALKDIESRQSKIKRTKKRTTRSKVSSALGKRKSVTKRAVKRAKSTRSRGQIYQDIQAELGNLKRSTRAPPKKTRSVGRSTVAARAAKQRYKIGPKALKERLAGQGGMMKQFERAKALMGEEARKELDKKMKRVVKGLTTGQTPSLKRPYTRTPSSALRKAKKVMGKQARKTQSQNIRLGKARAKATAVSPMPSSWVQKIGYDKQTKIMYALLGETIHGNTPADYWWDNVEATTYWAWYGAFATCRTTDTKVNPPRWRRGDNPSLGAAWWYIVSPKLKGKRLY